MSSRATAACYHASMRNRYSSADLHIHTTASDGTATPADVCAWVAERTDLSVIAIADHNTVDGALEAAAIAPGFGIEVVVGQEVESADGHVIGLWTPRAVEPGLSAEETVIRIHAQGGLAVAAHPFAPDWWDRHGLARFDPSALTRTFFDAVEVANSTPLLCLANLRAQTHWRQNRDTLARVGGSDAHMLSVIGTSRTLFRGSTSVDLRTAIENRTTHAWGPAFSLTRTVRYARKIPEIKMRDRATRARRATGETG